MGHIPPPNAIQFYPKNDMPSVGITNLAPKPRKILDKEFYLDGDCYRSRIIEIDAPDSIENLFISDNFDPLKILLDPSHRNHTTLRKWLGESNFRVYKPESINEDIYITLPEPMDLVKDF